LEGILNIHKPAGITSFGVVAKIKKITGERHVGHGGTLDPLASGVLPVFLGSATRAMEYLSEQAKTYRAEIELGVTTDSYDSAGEVTGARDASKITREMVEKALSAFRASIRQTPPMYSALKYKGQPLYKLARRGVEVQRTSRPVQIYRLEIVAWQPAIVTLEVTCSKGTYIRSLAHDLGEVLGCGAYLKTLVRLRVGPFSLDEALTLTQIEEAFSSGGGNDLLYPIDHVLTQFPAMVVKKEQQCSLIHGSPLVPIGTQGVSPPAPEDGTLSRVYTEDGAFLGLLRYQASKAIWQPEKIFLRECPGCGNP
jgi:tRNA pseudouridine55 synthase